ncbi:MAG: hypothetical protein IKD69_00265 [Solobacterium sp.]|nr:hypothetical protein [Solobacterium sp.]
MNQRMNILHLLALVFGLIIGMMPMTIQAQNRPAANSAVILIEEAEHGSVSCDAQPYLDGYRAYGGSTVQLTVEPEEGWHLESLTAVYYSRKTQETELIIDEYYRLVVPDESFTYITVYPVFAKGQGETTYYAISTSAFDHTRGAGVEGVLTADKESAAPGETVTLTLSLQEGMRLMEGSGLHAFELYNCDTNHPDFGRAFDGQLTKVDDTHYTFIMPEHQAGVVVHVEAEEYSLAFPDYDDAPAFLNIMIYADGNFLTSIYKAAENQGIYAVEGLHGGQDISLRLSSSSYAIAAVQIRYEKDGREYAERIEGQGAQYSRAEFTMPCGDAEVTFEFTRLYSVHYNNQPNHGSASADATVVFAGTPVRITAASDDPAYTVIEWSGYYHDVKTGEDRKLDYSMDNGNDGTSSISFVMPEGDVYIDTNIYRESISYLHREFKDGRVQTKEEFCRDYKYMTGADSYADGWYVLNQDRTYDSKIEISGVVNLILMDGKKLTAEKGIYIRDGSTLIIWGQRYDSGYIYSNSAEDAAIGGKKDAVAGNLVINGGKITAYGDKYAAGIGGGDQNSGIRSITINGGNIYAVGGRSAAGIGKGRQNNVWETITINGGQVEAYGGKEGAGIGGSEDRGNGPVVINGGNVTAYGGDCAAGIGGGGEGSQDCSVTINGGIVKCVGERGAGIGGGGNSGLCNGGVVTINGGIIESSAPLGGQAIGCGIGDGKNSGILTINGGSLDLYGGAAVNVVGSAEGKVYFNGGYTRLVPERAGTTPGTGIYIDEDMMVYRIDEDDNFSPANAGERLKALRESARRVIQVCEHSQPLLCMDDDSGEHVCLNSCRWCGAGSSGRDKHIFDPETHTCQCGHKEYPFVIENIGLGSGTFSYTPLNQAADNPGYISSGAPFRMVFTPPSQHGLFSLLRAYYIDENGEEINAVWQREEDAENEYSYIFSEMPETSLHLNVQIGERAVLITYDPAGGSGSIEPQKEITGTMCYLSPALFTPPYGKVFAGWQIDDRIYRASGQYGPIPGDVTAYAVWTDAPCYTVSFDPGEGSGQMADALAYLPSLTVTTASFILPDCTFTAPSGKVFAGWQQNQEEPGMAGEEILVGKDTVLTAQWGEPDPSFKGQSLSLNGQIGVVFYLELPKWVDFTGSYMKFMVNGKVETDPLDVGHRDPDGHGWYGFTCHLRSIEMAEEITAEFYYGEKMISCSTSAESYIIQFERIKSAYDKETIDLVEATADFGHYVQPYLMDARHWTFDDYQEMKTYFRSSFDYQAIQEGLLPYAAVRKMNGSAVDQVNFSLVVDSDTAIHVYFSLKDGYEGGFTARADGNEAVVDHASGMYRVKIGGIGAHQLDEIHTIEIETSSGTEEITVSALSYAKLLFDYEEASENAKRAMAAIWHYSQAAEGYRKTH